MTGPLKHVQGNSPATQITPQGAFLMLECGHRVWIGGLKHIPALAECLTGPCFKPGRLMGNGR